MPQNVVKIAVRDPHRPQRLRDRLFSRHRREVGTDEQPIGAEHVDEVPDRAMIENQ